MIGAHNDSIQGGIPPNFQLSSIRESAKYAGNSLRIGKAFSLAAGDCDNDQVISASLEGSAVNGGHGRGNLDKAQLRAIPERAGSNCLTAFRKHSADKNVPGKGFGLDYFKPCGKCHHRHFLDRNHVLRDQNCITGGTVAALGKSRGHMGRGDCRVSDLGVARCGNHFLCDQHHIAGASMHDFSAAGLRTGRLDCRIGHGHMILT